MSSKNKIIYGDYVFLQKDFKSGNLHLATSLLSSALESNTFSAVVRSYDRSITDFMRNAPLTYFYNDQQVGVFYVQSIDRIAPEHYKISATSTIGLLSDGLHYGGIYSGETVSEILPGICGPVPYEVKTNLRDIALYGWLPVATPRDNLAQVLFAIGATVKTDLDGILRIEPLWDGVSGSVGVGQLFQGPSVSYNAKVTRVVVTEHQYTAGVEDAELFEGATQQGDIITFSEPMHSLTATGFSIIESGANYAVVTAGAGILSGKKYIHNTRQIARSVSAAQSGGSENVKSVTDATLVSLVNSAAVAERLANYYGCLETISGDIVLNRQSPGNVVNVYHPYDKEMVQACIESLDITASGILRASTKQLVGFKPLQIEQTVTYDEHELLTGSGTWTVPEGVTEVVAVLIPGGQAGYDGTAGEDCPAGGSIPYIDRDSKSYEVAANGSSSASVSASRNAAGGSAGKGGTGGDPGSSGKVLQVTVKVSPGQVISYVCGIGGTSNGAVGTPTTFGENTSESGGAMADGYTDLVTGITYAKSGTAGGDGGDGGSIGEEGESVGNASGGEGYEAVNQNYPSSGVDYPISGFEFDWSSSASFSDGGAGGGGAGGQSGSIDGSPGGNAAMGEWSRLYNWDYAISEQNMSASGNGGAGADGAGGQTYGCGGNGGAGGGGAGAIGNGSVSAQLSGTFTNRSAIVQKTSIRAEATIYPRSGGKGGPGGSGGPGADGCIILYYGKIEAIKTGAVMGAEGRIRFDRYGRLMVG